MTAREQRKAETIAARRGALKPLVGLRYVRRPGSPDHYRTYRFEQSPDLTAQICAATGYRFDKGYLGVGGVTGIDWEIIAGIFERRSLALFGETGKMVPAL